MLELPGSPFAPNPYNTAQPSLDSVLSSRLQSFKAAGRYGYPEGIFAADFALLSRREIA
jgi:hypothetical protein